ncbi:RagB/SusD family nutrient uptake outer membrane protein [Ravibacter arvi]|uniref:RagB/SusD family nutrient uptake outer membrane protein n=1 Tax=Ravibacter arvi TaxID=2051041 RepID=A0ABP8M008_9BACT
MKKLNIYAVLLQVSLAASLFSCKDLLDKEPNDFSSGGFYKSEAAVKTGLTGVYQNLYYFPAARLPFNVMLDHWTPMATERAENTTIGAGGSLNPDNAVIIAFWTNLFGTVARANSVLSGAEPFLSTLEGKSAQYLAETRVLRAYAYYQLIANFGDVPFFTKPVTTEEYKVGRTDRAVVLDFILEDLEKAAADLPWITTERGRVDKAAALGLKARAALLGGSLNYGGKGAEYFKASAAAAKQVIGQRALAQKYDDLFTKQGQAKADVKNETLFEIMFSDQGSQQYHWIGFGQVSRNYGQTGRHPSQILVDTYECIDGKRIDESPLYNPKKPSLNRDPRFKSTIWMHGDTVQGNTTGNDNGRIKFVLEAYNPKTSFYNFNTNQWVENVNADINSGAAWTSFVNAGMGYIWKKFSNETSESVNLQTCNVPLLRYAEVLLTYAEAKIELNELDQSVYDAIDQVRVRSGMPKVSADRIGNQDKMRQLVRRERKVELIMEGLHFTDMRRWNIGDLTNAGPSYGFPIATSLDAGGNLLTGGYKDVTPDMIPNFKLSARHDLNDVPSYEAYKEKLKVRDRNRFWNDRFNLLPVPQLEIDRNPNLKQNKDY